MDHQKIKELISPYYDGELDEEQKKLVEKHMGECVECRKEFDEMGKFEEVMNQMKLKEPPKEASAVERSVSIAQPLGLPRIR